MVTAFTSLIVLVTTIYLAILISTNSLMREVESVFLLEVDRSVTEGRAIDLYNWVADSIDATDREVGEINLSLRRAWVWHNFRNGYIWAEYTHVVYDIDGNMVTGSWRVPTKWRIERMNGSWEIVEIFERP